MIEVRTPTQHAQNRLSAENRTSVMFDAADDFRYNMRVICIPRGGIDR